MLDLHPAADGMLARLRVPGGRVTAVQLAAIADLAVKGNGIVELTSRANVQVRGLGEEPSERLAPALADAGLLPSPEHERVRNILAPPLGNRHPASRLPVDEIVAALDRALCADAELADLPGRVLFLVEDGAGVLGGFAHDIALVPASGAAIALLVDGADSGLRATDEEAAALLALRAARAFLAATLAVPRAWSVRELPGGARDVLAALAAPGATHRVPWPSKAPAPLRPGTARQADGRVALTALAPLGRLNETQLRSLGAIAGEVRLSPWRTVTLLDVAPRDASRVGAALREIGLVLDAASGWGGLSACAGLGACRSARADVRALAAARVGTRAADAPAEHWAACARRCGERPGTEVAVAVLEDGVAVRRGADESLVADVDEALAVLGGPQ